MAFLWHYTTGEHFKSIVRDGLIRAGTVGIPSHEKPMVWFSKNQFWEPTVNKLLRDPNGVRRLSMMEMHNLPSGIVRIGVAPETAPHDWRAFKELSGVRSRDIQHMYDLAIKQRARPGEWAATFDPVPREKWLAVEVFDGRNWLPLADMENIAANMDAEFGPAADAEQKGAE